MKIPDSGTMEDGPNSAPHNGQLGPINSGGINSPGSNNNSGINNKTGSGGGIINDDGNGSSGGGGSQTNNPRSSQYSIPGILHFIQHEWARFEMERSQWDVERAELQVMTCPSNQTRPSNSVPMGFPHKPVTRIQS